VGVGRRHWVVVEVGPPRVREPALVVAVVDEPDRTAFAHGPLAGHPVSGEESFVVEHCPESRRRAAARVGPGWEDGGVPRANRRRRDEPALDLARAIGGAPRREAGPDGESFVRRVAGGAAGRSYRCPGCDQVVGGDQPHVVAWPADGPRSDAAALGDRRHWHTPCWAARGRRR
jgi:hypothetical protein